MEQKSLEQEMDLYLKSQGLKFYNYTVSPVRLDFTIFMPHGGEKFFLEVKEKRKTTKISQWPKVNIPEPDLFILDDLSARKILKMAPNSGLIVRTNLTNRYYFFDVVTLWEMPRLRVNRALNEEKTVFKGKWMIDLRNGYQGNKLDQVFGALKTYYEQQEQYFREPECFGNFRGEHIGVGGEVRTRAFKIEDYNATR
jgi:hypothetical protein